MHHQILSHHRGLQERERTVCRALVYIAAKEMETSDSGEREQVGTSLSRKVRRSLRGVSKCPAQPDCFSASALETLKCRDVSQQVAPAPLHRCRSWLCKSFVELSDNLSAQRWIVLAFLHVFIIPKGWIIQWLILVLELVHEHVIVHIQNSNHVG